VTADQNARDQLLAYAIHVPRHRPDQAGPWMAGAPEPDLPARLAELGQLMAEVRRLLAEGDPDLFGPGAPAPDPG
jgi:hypothetical protein